MIIEIERIDSCNSDIVEETNKRLKELGGIVLSVQIIPNDSYSCAYITKRIPKDEK